MHDWIDEPGHSKLAYGGFRSRRPPEKNWKNETNTKWDLVVVVIVKWSARSSSTPTI